MSRACVGFFQLVQASQVDSQIEIDCRVVGLNFSHLPQSFDRLVKLLGFHGLVDFGRQLAQWNHVDLLLNLLGLPREDRVGRIFRLFVEIEQFDRLLERRLRLVPLRLHAVDEPQVVVGIGLRRVDLDGLAQAVLSGVELVVLVGLGSLLKQHLGLVDEILVFEIELCFGVARLKSQGQVLGHSALESHIFMETGRKSFLVGPNPVEVVGQLLERCHALLVGFFIGRLVQAEPLNVDLDFTDRFARVVDAFDD